MTAYHLQSSLRDGVDVVCSTLEETAERMARIVLAPDKAICKHAMLPGLRMFSACDRPVHLWGKSHQGIWIRLDPEELVTAYTEPEKRVAFEQGVINPHMSAIPTFFRLSMYDTDGQHSVSDHMNIVGALQNLGKTWNYTAPLEPRFIWAIWRSGAEPETFAISARMGQGSAAVPLRCMDIDAALASGHAMFTYVSKITTEAWRPERPWASTIPA